MNVNFNRATNILIQLVANVDKLYKFSMNYLVDIVRHAGNFLSKVENPTLINVKRANLVCF